MWELSNDDMKYFSCKICGDCPSYYRCKYCHKRLCKKCHVSSFCEEHYNKIPHNFTIKLKNADKEIIIAYGFLAFYCCVLLPVLMATNLSFLKLTGILSTIITSSSFLFIFVAVIVCVISEKNKKKIIGEITGILHKNDN